MTGADLYKKHRKEFDNKELREDLLAFIDANDPARRVAKEAANDRLHGAAVFLNEIVGFQHLRTVFAALGAAPDAEKEVPDTFANPEI